MYGRRGWHISNWILFDLIDSEKQGVYHYLFDEDDEPNSKYIGMYTDVIYIDEIFIEEKYRHQGIGSIEDTQYLVVNMDYRQYV